MRFITPLYLFAALYTSAGVFHYRSGPDFTDTLPLPATYDLTRDPWEDLRTALRQAKSENKRVMVEVGGDWCSWCLEMDRFLTENADLGSLRDKFFVTVRIAVPQISIDNPVLASFPPIPGFPHIFIMSPDGTILISKNTEELELGRSYDRERFIAFLYAAGQNAPTISGR